MLSIGSAAYLADKELLGTFSANLETLQDESQILYYEGRLREMPIPVLKRHGIVEKDGDLIRLNVEKLSLQEKGRGQKNLRGASPIVYCQTRTGNLGLPYA